MDITFFNAIIGLMTGSMMVSLITGMREFVWIAIGLGFIALVFPSYARGIALLWRNVAHGIGFLILYIMLTGLFFIILAPFAVLRRFFVHSAPFQLKKKISGSYYLFRGHSFNAADFEKPW